MAGSFTPTPQQLEAIETTGRSVLVSAAAGSGKTAVLAERCAYLACDAPDDQRCSVDELLVLTFTEAAAAEMRSRIVDAIRRRAADQTADARLQEQLARVETAQISTIHSFCLWLVRRWFSEVGVDPSAAVMDADEASLLKKEVLDAIFAERYAAVVDPRDPLGARNLGPPSPTEGGSAAASASDRAIAFARLVDDYGLGEDRWIGGVILRLYEFTTSLPDWRRWLTDAVESVSSRWESVLLAFAEALELELRLQAGHCRATAATLAAWGRPAASYQAQVRDYADRLEDWLAEMAEDPPADGNTSRTPAASTAVASWARLSNLRAPVRFRLQQFERVRQDIGAFKFEQSRQTRGGATDDEEARAVREAARKLYSKVKDRLFRVRLRDRFGRFSVAELAANLAQTQPYVETLTELVASFHEAYAARKRRLNVLDFADLERFAFDLLHDGTDGGTPRPSAVAKTLHQRFAHVLVDEFQDINPVQQAILQLVSRESDPGRPNNLFAVGDVKQSIYRFRLAEPRLFVERLRRFQRGRGQGTSTSDRDPQVDLDKALFLQSNFRSRPSILEAVNAVFRGLMGGGLGDIAYGPDEELRPGLANVQPPPEPVEVHVLDRVWNLREGGAAEHDAEAHDEPSDADSVEEDPYVDLGDPAQWTPIEREAYLVGTRTRQWLAGGSTEAPRRLRDVVVLLRATKVNAERMAAVLQAMGVPAFAQVGGSLFAAREVRDVTAALRLLDNPQQDVPAAAVLRSGILGLRLSADELAEIRLLDRGAPFHEAVWRYGRDGPDDSLRRRLSDFAMTVDRYRDLARRRPLPETLWSIYENQGFLAYVCGLPNGSQRRANLLRVHELARRFSSFRRQGLRRFLQFLESLEADGRQMEAASGLGESEDVVRIMSVHQSKGLEFPLVFVAGLGNQFHLGDRNGRILFERGSRIGLRVVDTARMIEYPTAAHHLVAAEVERTTREEEMRVLYVAMTRAKDKLVLVGSCRDAERWDGSSHLGRPVRVGPTPLSISTAATPLDWLLPIVTDGADGAASTNHAGLRSSADQRPLFSVRCYLAPEMAQWGLARVQSEGQAMRRAIAGLEPLPDGEPIAADDPEGERVRSRVEYVYPRLATSSISATLAASEFGRFEALTDDAPDRRRAPDRGFSIPPSKYAAAPSADAAYRGTLTHRVLQHLNFAATATEVGHELGRLVQQQLISPEDQALVDVEGLAWFLSTPLADRIRRAGTAYRREFRFIAMEPLDEIDPTLVGEREDHVLVRGIVDGVLAAPEGLTLIDFKTDGIAAGQVPERAAVYEPQLRLYARAALKLWRRPVRECLLVFLTPRQIVPLDRLAPGSGGPAAP